MPRNTFLCRYRSDGLDFAARISAADIRDAARRMRELDWAPGCGPIGEPETEQPAMAGAPPATERQAILHLPAATLMAFAMSLRHLLGGSSDPVGQ